MAIRIMAIAILAINLIYYEFIAALFPGRSIGPSIFSITASCGVAFMQIANSDRSKLQNASKLQGGKGLCQGIGDGDVARFLE